ncbi:MAG: hypothetical protein Ct9H90mP24_2460 [Methanobacteriota archaeon]|nr:MAG: hypothetical protein Ct9H90mP24_2460 [Euryarchaeota archaeon]
MLPVQVLRPPPGDSFGGGGVEWKSFLLQSFEFDRGSPIQMDDGDSEP